MDSLLWGALLRLAQATLHAIPTFIVGLLVAGVLRQMLGYAGIRKLFGDNTWRSLPQAWLVGMLLPVCSLGVIPILREMRKAGVSGGTLLAFGLTAPLFNPISVLYGLTLANPIVILTFAFCSLAIVTVMGVAWDRFYPGTIDREPEPKQAPQGIKRILSIGTYMARESVGVSTIYVAIGLLGVAVLSLVLPQGYLQTAAEANDPFSPLFMAVVAIPIYATPMTAMVQLASMFQHGNSVGAAFALLVLGAGANLGLVAWLLMNYGVTRAAASFGLLLLVVVGLAYAVDKPLYPQGVDPVGHSHAFDMYCAPFPWSTTAAFSQAVRLLGEDFAKAPHEAVALMSFAAITLIGISIRVFDRRQWLQLWIEKSGDSKPRFDMNVPAPVLGGVTLIMLVALSVFGCYLYYPPPREIFEEISLVNVEVVSATTSKNHESGLYWIPIYEDWTRKLEVAAVLRRTEVTPFRRAKADVLRNKLELLEHELEDEDFVRGKVLAMQVNESMRRLKLAYDIGDN